MIADFFSIFDPDWWMDENNNALQIADAILFLIMALPVLYLFICALFSLPERFTEKRTLCQHHLAIRQRIAGNTDTGRIYRDRSIGKICVCSKRFRYGALSPHRGGTVDRRQSAANNRRTLATGTLRYPGTDESAGRDESKAHQ